VDLDRLAPGYPADVEPRRLEGGREALARLAEVRPPAVVNGDDERAAERLDRLHGARGGEGVAERTGEGEADASQVEDRGRDPEALADRSQPREERRVPRDVERASLPGGV